MVRPHVTAFLCAVAVVFAGCKKVRPAPNPGACIGAVFRVLDAAKTGEQTKPEVRAAAACSELYRHAACGDAWKRELTIGDSLAEGGIHAAAELPDAARIASACAKAYCGELSSKPSLCSAPPPSDNAELVTALGKLDIEILTYELGDRNMATGLAVRAAFFRAHTIPIELPASPAGADKTTAVFSIEIASDESIALDGRAVGKDDLGRELEKLEGLSERRAVIRADRNASHGRVIEVVDALKRAGVKKIAFSVNPAEAPAPPASAR